MEKRGGTEKPKKDFLKMVVRGVGRGTAPCWVAPRAYVPPAPPGMLPLLSFKFTYFCYYAGMVLPCSED